MTQSIQWPKKTREYQSNHFDSTIWNDLKFRDDDIVISTYGKAGTTWTQQIVGQLIFQGQEGIDVAAMSPWLDLRVPPKEIKLPMVEAQTHRRFLKTHLPVDALVYSPRAKYLYIGRDGRDVIWSMYNHHARGNAAWYAALNDTPGLVGPRIEPPPADIRQYFNEWLAFDGYPFWSFWDNVNSWWALRSLPNILFVHFADMKADLKGEITRIANFLDIKVDPAKMGAIVEHCSFGYMKEHAELSAPLGGALWEGGGKTFINKGTNGRWRDELSPAESAAYEQKALEKLGPECAAWMAHGAASKSAQTAA